MKKYESLRKTLIIAFVLLSVFVISLVFLIEFYFTYKTQEDVIFKQQSHILENAADEISNFLGLKFTILENTALLKGPYDTNFDDQKKSLNKIIGKDPSIRNLLFVDLSGNISASASRLSSANIKRLRFNASEILEKTRVNGKYVSNVYIDNGTNEPLIIIAVPIRDVFDTSYGLLIAEINLKFLWDFVENIEVGEGGAVYVVDNTGRLIAFEDIGRVISGEDLSYLVEVKEFLQHNEDETPKISKGINGNLVVTTQKPLESGWAVVT